MTERKIEALKFGDQMIYVEVAEAVQPMETKSTDGFQSLYEN